MLVGWFADLCVADVARSRDFYVALVGVEVLVDHGWYAELGIGGRVALALVDAGHETVPRVAGAPARGVLASFEVDDAAVVAVAATSLGCAVVVPLVEELGQRHVMVLDPDGTIVDVIERIAVTGDDRRRLAALRRGRRADR